MIKLPMLGDFVNVSMTFLDLNVSKSMFPFSVQVWFSMPNSVYGRSSDPE